MMSSSWWKGEYFNDTVANKKTAHMEGLTTKGKKRAEDLGFLSPNLEGGGGGTTTGGVGGGGVGGLVWKPWVWRNLTLLFGVSGKGQYTRKFMKGGDGGARPYKIPHHSGDGGK